MIRAKDLMIGDWVQFSYGIRKVTELDSFLDRICSADFSVGEVDGVPLTPEILEKNGWRKEFDKKPYMTFYHLEDEKYWLMWCISEHTIDVQRQNKTLLDKYNLCAERVVIACDYVHQLQHCLKLVGIEKEITI